jgi:hypothetical protein
MNANSVTYLKDLEMNSTSSYNPLQVRKRKVNDQETVYSLNDGKMVNIRRKSRIQKNGRDVLLFDAIGIQFHLNIFFKQFFMHIFFPALLFFSENPTAQGVRRDFPSIWWTCISPLLVYIMIGSYFSLSDSDQNVLGQALFIPLMLYAVHRIIIALKYASLSVTEYDRFMKCKDPATIKQFNSQIHLDTGWVGLDLNVLFFEIGAASARIGIKVNEVFLYICNTNASTVTRESNFRFWNAFLRGHDTIDWDAKPAPEIQHLPTGRVGVSVFNIVMALILRAAGRDAHIPSYINVFLFIIVWGIVAISFIPFVIFWGEIDQPIAAVFFQVTSTIINVQFGYVFFSILYIAIIDVKRQLRMVQMLHCMIRSTDLMMESNLSLLPLSEDSAHRCREVVDARVNAILSITDNHEWKYLEPTEAIAMSFPATTEEENQEEVGNNNNSKKCFFSPDQRADINNYNVSQEEMKDIADNDENNNNNNNNNQVNSYNEFDLQEQEDRDSEVLGENIARASSYAVTPRVSFNYPENVIAWLYTRLTIQHFGDRFRFRIDAYVGKTANKNTFFT